jgi:hypothetical protein
MLTCRKTLFSWPPIGHIQSDSVLFTIACMCFTLQSDKVIFFQFIQFTLGQILTCRKTLFSWPPIGHIQ